MKTEAHQQYSDDAGRFFPGVTTVLNVLDKPWLVKWANNLGLKGIDSSRYTAERGEIGSLAHYLIMCDLTGQPVETDDYSTNQLKEANLCLDRYFIWKAQYKPEVVLIEKHFTSTKYCYGGTLDLLAWLHFADRRELNLIDFKTSNFIGATYYAQLAAYSHLLLENGYTVENARVVKIGVNPETDTFDERQLLKLDQYWRLFLHCLSIYNLHLS